MGFCLGVLQEHKVREDCFRALLSKEPSKHLGRQGKFSRRSPRPIISTMNKRPHCEREITKTPLTSRWVLGFQEMRELENFCGTDVLQQGKMQQRLPEDAHLIFFCKRRAQVRSRLLRPFKNAARFHGLAY